MTAPIPRDLPDLPPIPGHRALLPSVVPATAVVTPVRRRLIASFRLLTALLALTGVTIALVAGGPVMKTLSHFTIQSGILLALVMIASARCAWSAHHPLPGAVTGAALFYAGTGWQTAANHILHAAVPLAAALDWLLLTVPGRLHLRHAPVWLLYPLAYLAFTLARGELLLPGTQDRYLYPFLDVDQHGFKGVLGNALLLGLALYALAVLLITADHIRPNPLRRPR